MSATLRLKFLSRKDASVWKNQLPKGKALLNDCEFIFDPDTTSYDWLVVYDDLPRPSDPINHSGTETLHCAPENTILVTSEPSTIKYYHKAYTHQFGWVLTSQEPWALRHSGRIYSQPALRWFYGGDQTKDLDEHTAAFPREKEAVCSTVCSSKQQKHTLHSQRYEFTHALAAKLPELDLFGRGIRAISDKSESLDRYRYHIAIENFIGPHHWTEKLADTFLGGCLPFYAGCTNLSDYFPEQSYIPIDINDIEGSYRTIKEAIDNNEYEKRLPHILEARRRVLEDYNIFAVIADIAKSKNADRPIRKDSKISDRRKLRKKPTVALEDTFGGIRVRLRHRITKTKA